MPVADMPALSSHSIDAETRRQLIELIYRNSLLAHAISLLVAALVVAAVVSEGRAAWIEPTIWFGALLAIEGGGIAHYLHFRRQPRVVEQNALWMWHYGGFTVAMAAAWAVGAFLFMPSASNEVRYFIAVVLTAIMAGAVPVLAGTSPFTQLFTGILAIPLFAIFLFFGRSTGEHLLAAGIVLYLIGILVTARRFNEMLLNSIRLGLERLELIASVQAARAQAEQASEAKSQFLANMSHEIRTSINAIIGYADIIMGDPAGREVPSHLATLRRSAKSLLNIVNDVLDLEKIEAGKLVLESTTFSLADTLEDLLGIYNGLARAKGLFLVLERAPDVPNVLVGDPLRVHQVLANLLSNAVKFTDRGWVELTVRTEADHGDRVCLRFAVRNTGIGIAEDKHELVFESFAQVDASPTRRHSGTGLGLAISRRLVELMGGEEIELESTRGRGSRFSFVLPSARGVDPDVLPAVATAGTDRPVRTPHGTESEDVRNPGAPRAPSRPLRVLLADDTEDNQRVFTTLLLRHGYLISPVYDGMQAVAAAEREPFDIVILDMHMPVMDGLEATCRLRQHEALRGKPRTPIIILTASMRLETRDACLSAGADDYLIKPVDLPELLAALNRVSTKALQRP
jgi:signal transduction histidine kinase/ActR/RegA family two-component response regulator